MKIKNILMTLFLLTLLYSCEKDTSNGNCTCTTYLNGNIWSKQTVSDCNSCIDPPQGYTKSCNCN